jgi:hypothetical protein
LKVDKFIEIKKFVGLEIFGSEKRIEGIDFGW